MCYLGCLSPLGMEDFRIKDSQITTSSVVNGTTAYGWQARLNQNIGDCTGAGRTIIEGGKYSYICVHRL